MNVSPTGGGVITSPHLVPPPTSYPETYDCSLTYTLTAVPNSGQGYKFVGWIGDNTSTSTTITVSVKNSSKSVTAVFAFQPEAVSLEEARTLINDRPGPVLIDVSSAADYNNSHILCAANYPWSTLRKQFDVGIAGLDPYKSDIILIYNQTGSGIKDAADYLAERGFAYVRYMTAGLDDWIAAGYDTYVPAEDDDICTSLAPMADAGPDQTVDEGVRVTLDGSGSADPGGSPLTYAWTQFKGSPTVTLTNAHQKEAAFTSPNLTSGDAELVFLLTVTNNAGKKHTDSANVNVGWFNDKPTADAGGDQTVETGKPVTLDGSGSYDPEDQPLSYQWRRSGGTLYPSLSSDTEVSPTFTAPNNSGYVEFTLTVTDNGGKTDSETVRVTVQSPTPANILPDADASADSTSVSPGATVILDGAGSSDPDGAIAAYAWEQTDATGKTVTLSDATAVNPTFTAPEVTKTTMLVFTLMVTDNDGAIDTAMVEITVNKPVENQAPTAVAAADQTSVSPGATVTLDGSGSSDPDGAVAAFAWEQTDTTGKTVTLSNPAAAKPTFTAPDVTETITLVFTLTVADNTGDTAVDTVRITVNKPSSSGGGGGGCFIDSVANSL